jgi:hypothetical protein
MAFGGVATGSMNANDVDMAVGSIRYRGLKFRLSACQREMKVQRVVAQSLKRIEGTEGCSPESEEN